MKTPTYQPRWTHDCTNCRFLGTDSKGGDWYVCERPKLDKDDAERRSLLRRDGHEGPDYTSCPIAGCVEMTQLEKRAALMGFEFTEYELARFGKRFVREQCFKGNIDDFREVNCSVAEDGLLGSSVVEDF